MIKKTLGALLPLSRKKLAVLGVGFVATLILVALAAFALTRSKQTSFGNKVQETQFKIKDSPNIASDSDKKLRDKSIDSLLKKASIFYQAKDKDYALSVFKDIASFSNSLANYNLGVLELKNKNYALALQSFSQALKDRDNISPIAFNAAIAAKKMGDLAQYSKFLALASDALSSGVGVAYYAYLYSLINYYQGNYFPSVFSAKSNNSKYSVESSLLNAKSFLVFDDNVNAIEALKRNEEGNLKVLGLLYAREGDFANAKKYLLSYQKDNPSDTTALMPLELIYLKIRDYGNAKAILDAINQLPDSKATKLWGEYPIKVVLRQDLFNVDIAQRDFIDHGIIKGFFVPDKMLFYYAPLKVFDLKKALLKLDLSSIFVANKIAEPGILESIKESSSLDSKIIDAINEVYRGSISHALEILESANKSNPNHAILHYDLGLLYAREGEYQKAYDHFLRSYYLNVQDSSAALMAILSSKFIKEDSSGIRNDLLENGIYSGALDSDSKRFNEALWRYVNGTYDPMSWLEISKSPKSIYYALKVAQEIALNSSSDKSSISFSLQQLIRQDKSDFIANVLFRIYKPNALGFKGAISELNSYLGSGADLVELVARGGSFEKQLYGYLGYISGTLHEEESALKLKLTSSAKNIYTTRALLQTLGIVNIYQYKFNEAYTIYNTLINDLKVDDSETQFFSAVASVGAENYNHAVLALQLSKLESSNNFETKLILGMLYQQAGNLRAAASHYGELVGHNFASNFFDFIIDNQKVLEFERAQGDR